MNINKKNPFSLNVKYFTDDRGVLSFCNEFNLSKFKRFYVIKNFHTNFIRAWHAHKKEDKAFMITKGSFQVSAVKIDNWKNPSKSSKVHNFYLSECDNKIIFVPRGFANGLRSLEPKSSLIVFSSSTLDESLKDDFRYTYNYWNPWTVNYR